MNDDACSYELRDQVGLFGQKSGALGYFYCVSRRHTFIQATALLYSSK